jgi:hypothetical protein
MHKSATKCNEIIGKWCINKHGASKIIVTFETYHTPSMKRSLSTMNSNHGMSNRSSNPCASHSLLKVISWLHSSTKFPDVFLLAGNSNSTMIGFESSGSQSSPSRGQRCQSYSPRLVHGLPQDGIPALPDRMGARIFLVTVSVWSTP